MEGKATIEEGSALTSSKATSKRPAAADSGSRRAASSSSSSTTSSSSSSGSASTTFPSPQKRAIPGGLGLPDLQRDSSTDPFVYDRSSVIEAMATPSQQLTYTPSGTQQRTSARTYARPLSTASIASITSDRNKDLPPPPPDSPDGDKPVAPLLLPTSHRLDRRQNASSPPTTAGHSSASLSGSSNPRHSRTGSLNAILAESATTIRPSSFIEDFVTAIHDYTSSFETCLSFKAGQVLRVINRDSSGWWDGELEGLRGWFPSNYVMATNIVQAAFEDAMPSPSPTDPVSLQRQLASSTQLNTVSNSHAMARAASSPMPSTSGQLQLRSFAFPSRTTSALANGMATSPMTPVREAFESAAPSPTSSSMVASNTAPIPSAASSTTLRPESPAFDFNIPSPVARRGLTSPVAHAVSLMQNAVAANRVSHFQPCTTCLIASVRSILSAMDCLSRESQVLRRHLILARERKLVLSLLASLVTQSRNASLDTLSLETRQHQAGKMLEMAEDAFEALEHLLATARRCGVHVPESLDEGPSAPQSPPLSPNGSQPRPTASSSSRSGSLSASSHLAASQATSLQDVSTPNLDACLQFFPQQAHQQEERGGISLFPAPSSATSKALHKAKSFGDVKGYRRKVSEASTTSTTSTSSSGHSSKQNHSASTSISSTSKQPSPPQLPKPNQSVNSAVAASMLRRPSIPVAYQTVALPSPTSWQGNDSISSTSSSAISSNGPPTPSSAVMPQQAADVYRILSSIHDQLLSTIAAFIGHVHAHTRSSHSSSYAHLIDMAREAIERVREALLVVDVVEQHPSLSSAVKELRAVKRAKEALFEATTVLVTSAKKVTTAVSPLGIESEMMSQEQEEAEKHQLLHAATSVLRTSADCVNATKPLLLKKGFEKVDFAIDLERSRTLFDDAATALVDPNMARSESGSTEVPSDEDATLHHADVQQPGMASEQGQSQDHSSPYAGGRDDGQLPESTHPRSAHPLTSPLVAVSARLGDTASTIDSEEHRAAQQGDDTVERSQSSLSERRGVPVPSSLHIVPKPWAVEHSRASSAGSGSINSIVTAIPRSDGQHVPTAPLNRPPQIGSAFSPATSAGSSASSPLDPLPRAGGEPMSRDESSRGSASTATSSSRFTSSDGSTADTSPRNSVSYPSPADEKIELHQQLDARRTTRLDYTRARSGSTPDRLAALRIAEANALHPLPSPSLASPRAPLLISPHEASSGARPWILERDYQQRECTFNADGNVTGGTLACLVERMTLHDQTIDPVFSNTFFLTFRIFTDPMTLAHALFDRFAISPPSNPVPNEAELKLWQEQKLTPVRLRIYNFFKTWLESHWRPDSDSVILEPLLEFTRQSMMAVMAAPAQRLVDLAQKRSILSASNGPGRPRGLTRMASAEKLKAGKPVFDGQPLASATFPGPASCLPPSPLVSKALYSALRTPPYAPSSILEFEPLELARQFTVMESKLYCSIQAEELIGQGEEAGRATGSRTTTIRMMSALSTRITGWIAENILNEQDAKKRTTLVKYFIKLGDRCLALQNFNTLMAILAALNSSTISRLRKTWDGLANKYKIILENLRKATEHSRNYAVYRATIRNAVPPCLPFLGLYLTDITFCRDGNPAFRASPHDPDLKLINFDRYQKMAKIVGDLQRFQQPYNLIEVPEIQTFLHSALSNVENGGDVQALYRRSLMVEPRQNGIEQPAYSSTTAKDIFGWRL